MSLSEELSYQSGEDEVILETPLSEGSKEGLAFSPYNPYQNVDEDAVVITLTEVRVVTLVIKMKRVKFLFI